MLGHINLSIQTLLAPGFEDEQHTDNHPQMDTHTHTLSALAPTSSYSISR